MQVYGWYTSLAVPVPVGVGEMVCERPAVHADDGAAVGVGCGVVSVVEISVDIRIVQRGAWRGSVGFRRWC